MDEKKLQKMLLEAAKGLKAHAQSLRAKEYEKMFPKAKPEEKKHDEMSEPASEELKESPVDEEKENQEDADKEAFMEHLARSMKK